MKSQVREEKDLFVRKLKNILKYSKEQKKGKNIFKQLFVGKNIKKVCGELMSEEEKESWLKSFLKYNSFRPLVAHISAQSFL